MGPRQGHGRGDGECTINEGKGRLKSGMVCNGLSEGVMG